MNAITPVTAETAGETRDGGTDVLYTPGERIFAMAGPMVRAQGWSIFPQERVGKRRPGRTRNGAIQWGSLCDEAVSDEDIALWRKDCSQLNVACAFGPASGNAFALDIDCMDEAVSARVQAIAAEVLGLSPLRRIGRAPKIALLYRHDGGGPPRSQSVELDGLESCKVEVLGPGKSLTFHGLHHETGRWFQWLDQNPLTSPPTEAPEVSAAAVEAFLHAVAEEFPFKEPPPRLPGFGLGVSGVADGIIVPARPVAEAGPVTDGREGHLRDLALATVLRNASMLTGAHGEGRLQEAAARVVAAVEGEFEAACAMTGRWTATFLRSQAVEKVGSAVAKLLSGDMKPPRTASLPAAAAVQQPEPWSDYLDLDSVLAEPPPPLDFVLPGILAGTLGVLVSPGGAGKSMLSLGLGACVAAGRSMWGLLPADPEPGVVLVVSAEDPRPLLAHRLHAMAHVPGGGAPLRGDAGFRERFRVKAVQGTGFGLGTWTHAGFQPSAAFDRLRREVEELRPRLVILDTLNRCLGGIPENDNAAMGRIVSELEAMVAPVGAACLVLHHVGKSAARDGSGDEQQAARGAGAITDNARWQGNLVGLGRDEADARGIPDEERRRWVRWAVSKGNYAVGMPDRWLWRDTGGVLRARELPEPPPARKGRGRGYDTE